MCGATLMAMAVAAPACAQDAASATPPDNDIVVTGSALASIEEKPILETPRTVQSVSGELVANISPSSILSVTKFLPGIASTVSYNDVRPQYNIRGIGAEVRRNGLLLTRVAIPIEDIEAVELLQGPGDVTQGGNKTPGGVLNYVSKRAVGSSFERVTLAVNDLGNVLGQADVNIGSRSGRFGVRANVGLEHIRLPNDVEGRRLAIALATRVDLTPQLTLDVDGYFNTAPRRRQLIIYPTFLTVTRLPGFNYHDRYGQRWSQDNYKRRMGEARLSGEFGDGWSALLQGALAKGRDLTYDGYVNPLAADGTATVRASKVLQYNYDTSTRAAITKRIDPAPWLSNEVSLVGDYYRLKLINAITNLTIATPINFFTNRDLPDPRVLLKPRALSRIAVTSGYGIADELTLSDRLVISGGIKRYIVDNKQYDFNNNGAFLNRIEQKAWLPNVSALFKMTPRWTTYVSYFKAFEPGTIVNFQFANQGDLLPPKRSETYEIGTKAQVRGVLLSLTGYRFVRPSTIIIPGPPGGLSIQSQSGAARYKGVDFSATGKPVRQLTVVGGFSVLDAKVTRTDQPATLGKFVTDAPRFQASLYAEYEARPGVFLNGGVFHRDHSELDPINTIEVPGYTTFDLGARYEGRIHERTYKLSLVAENIGGKKYFAGSSFGSPKLGGPRTIKVIASHDF